ncbi:MAG: hypothetical protein AAGM22_30305 [Acidobacteriota bacterium]
MLDVRKTVLAFGLAALTAAAPSSGLCGSVCEISIRPDAISVPLETKGWLYPDSMSAVVTVIEEPIFGTWASEVYTPSEDFLVVGGDRIRFEVEDTLTGGRTLHTVVLNLASSPYLLYSENFDQLVSLADLPYGFVVEGEASMAVVDDPRTAGRELLLDLDATGVDASVRREDPPIHGDGRDNAHIIGVVNASPPDENRIPGAVLEPFTATVLELGTMAYAQLRYTATLGFEARAVAGAGTTCVGCATPWQSVTEGHDYRIRLSFGRSNVQHPDGSNTYSLEIRYRDLDGSWQHADEIVGLSLPASFNLLPLDPSFGAFDLSGIGQATLTYDDMEARVGFLLGSWLRHRVEEFEGGAWSSDWQTTGNLAAVFVEREVGALGSHEHNWWGAVSFTDAYNNGDAQWSDMAPSQSSTLWAHLRLDHRRLDLPNWGSFILLEANEATVGQRIVHARVRANGQGVLEMSVGARDGSLALVDSPWISLPTNHVDIDLAWDGLGGNLELWFDGQLAASVSLVPHTYTLNRVAIGMKNAMIGNGGSLLTDPGLFIDDIVLQYR